MLVTISHYNISFVLMNKFFHTLSISNGPGQPPYLNKTTPSIPLHVEGVDKPKEDIVPYSISNSKKSTCLNFNQWLAGLIDGDGYFSLSKKGYAALEITLELRDQSCLFQIKDKFGGSIKIKQGQKWLRYRLHHKKGLISLICSINGLIRNPIRILQLQNICAKYDLTLLDSDPLTWDNAWLAGFIDSDGSIYLNITSGQIFISVSQKNKLLLDPLVNLYGGKIYIESNTQSFKWIVFVKDQVLKLTDYFKTYPLKSKKMVRVRLIPAIYSSFKESGHKSSSMTIKGKIWSKLIKKWENYG